MTALFAESICCYNVDSASLNVCCCCCQGPDSDQDDESELSIAELKVQRDRQKKEVEVLRQVEAQEIDELVQRKMKAEQDVGCTWGFGKHPLFFDADFSFLRVLDSREHMLSF